jgi:hypothetical protein
MRSIALLCLLVFAALVATPVHAHGPTVELSADAIEPALLEIEPRQTVHFHTGSDRTLRIRGDEDAFRSPELVPGEGWHVPFPFSGRFEYALEHAPTVRGAIVVGTPE